MAPEIPFKVECDPDHSGIDLNEKQKILTFFDINNREKLITNPKDFYQRISKDLLFQNSNEL
ncbi:hypothetical protein [Candidatus Nitrosocosmicus hydrocola]|uniref:hypothetical protein n=1 Tax=Candidatus Nitrosocosmicus hydrocola TaxID=1826872 RepID=UPI0011E599A1|nr:hypothetical protein [Candidatus Nitrosocosmicus hydrocola]